MARDVGRCADDLAACRREIATNSSGAMRPRSVPLLLALAGITIAMGLASRWYPQYLPVFVAKYAGDTLWATLVFWLLATVWRRASAAGLAALAIAISFAVEVSQLFHAGWIDSIRATTIGALVLGSGFLWSDFPCYVVGATLAADSTGRSPASTSDPALRLRALFLFSCWLRLQAKPRAEPRPRSSFPGNVLSFIDGRASTSTLLSR